MIPELRKCPFCGGEAKLCEIAKYYDKTHYVGCKRCHNRTEDYGTARTAIKHWNRRIEEEVRDG